MLGGSPGANYRPAVILGLRAVGRGRDLRRGGRALLARWRRKGAGRTMTGGPGSAAREAGMRATRVTRKRREKRAGALRGWSECVWAGQGEAGAHAGPLRARRAECVRVESAQERGSTGAGPAGPRAGEGRRVGPGKNVWAEFFSISPFSLL